MESNPDPNRWRSLWQARENEKERLDDSPNTNANGIKERIQKLRQRRVQNDKY